MEFCNNYFKQKNTKRGMALSTAMAIAIVLTLLVTALVTMATLNITTTQSTVSQRDAYIQAKSALSFAESYYENNTDKIPGGGSLGKALIVFKDDKISSGADIYITEGTSTMDPTTIQTKKDNAKSTYVEVVNNGAQLQFTAYCKYGNDNMYSLSKEFDLTASTMAAGNPWKGNIRYEIGSETRYLRIHVRTSPGFTSEPYLYTWANEYNPAAAADGGSQQRYGSSLVNKLANASGKYSTQKLSGEWDGEKGPTKAMTYEGNGWYLTQIELSTETNMSSVNAIVTQKDAHRTGVGGTDTSQSWELFGIPVPAKDDTGSANGTDVYITLNKSQLKDARDEYGDLLTHWFEVDHHANIDDFAQFSADYYSVYTKQNIGTIHVRKANEIGDTDSLGLGGVGFEYEGYGWWRSTSNNLSDTVTIDGHTYSYDDGDVISQNSENPNREVVKELFVCVEGDDGDGTNAQYSFGSEAEANECLYNEFGDVNAGDYVTVNVKANNQPVKEKVPTSINYNYEFVSVSTDVTPPDDLISTDSDASGDSDAPEVVPTSADEDLAVLPLGKKTAVQQSGATNNTQPSGASISSGTKIFVDCSDKDSWWADPGCVLGVWYWNTGGGVYYRLTTEDAANKLYSFTPNYDIVGFKLLRVDVSDPTADGAHTFPGNCFNESADMMNDSLSGEGYSYGKNCINIKSESDAWWTTRADDTPTTSDYYVIGDFGPSYNSWVANFGDCYLMELSGGYYQYVFENVPGKTDVQFKIVKNEGKSNFWDNAQYPAGGEDGNYVYGDLAGESELAMFRLTVTYTPSGNAINVIKEQMSDGSSENYYIVGTINNWAANDEGVGHQFDIAKNYPLAKLSENVYTYKATVNPGDHSVKVISDEAELTAPDSEGKTINYDYSWGEMADGSSMGSGKSGVPFTVDVKSYVTFRFTYDKDNPGNSILEVLAIDPVPFEEIKNVPVAFYNNKLTDVNVDNKKPDTGFTHPWAEVYVTYKADGSISTFKITDIKEMNYYWASIPSNATDVYFSNMAPEHKGESGYEYTEFITDFSSTINPIFFPKTSETVADVGVKWTVGGKEEFMSYIGTVLRESKETPMVYTGTNRISYYDVPIVNALELLLPEGAPSCVVFSPKAYTSYKIGTKTYRFDANQYVTYQGERYYYVKRTDYTGCSTLIVNVDETNKCGLLDENDFGLTEVKSDPGTLATGMNNRAGATFTSTGEYYGGSYSPSNTRPRNSTDLNYDGYSPNWYTFKIPTTSKYTINSIKGVSSSSTNVGVGVTLEAVPAADYYNQPLYIFEEGGTTIKAYTYDTEYGKVDADEDANVSIYYDNTCGWSKVKVHAVGLGSLDAYDDEVHLDSTSGDGTNYYVFTMKDGQYQYFEFYNGNKSYDQAKADGDITGVLCLTGEENADTRECKILASGKATGFDYYLHPKTKALYAFHEARSAYFGSGLYMKYSYDAVSKTYNPDPNPEDSFKYMSTLEAKMNAAKDYYKNNTSWSSSGSSSYASLAEAANQFTDAIRATRAYIACSDPEHPDNPNYIFPEGENRGKVIIYDSAWVASLRGVYDQAMKLYSDSSLQTEGNMRAYAAELNSIIAHPVVEIAPTAVTIIVDDQIAADASGAVTGGGWGKSNLSLMYRINGGAWAPANETVFDTTQEGYYAFAFALPGNGTTDVVEYALLNGTTAVGSDDEIKILEEGNRYFFKTANPVGKRWSTDKSTPSINVSIDKIEQGGANEGWAKRAAPNNASKFILYFMYDTEVKWDGDGNEYTIYAGGYTIDASYAGWSTDLSGGKKGINLFTPNAKAFFTNPTNYGMSEAPSGYEVWNNATKYSTPTTGTKNIMCERMQDTMGSTYYAEATPGTSDSRINFRFRNVQGSDTLNVTNKVEMTADTVTMAVNNIDMSSGKEFVINSKSVTFYTDTVVKLRGGSTYTIVQGTWVFNSTLAGEPEKVDLTDKTWMDKYQLMDESNSNLSGGIYVSSNN